MNYSNYIRNCLSLLLSLVLLPSCSGIFDDIYDEPADEIKPAVGQLVVDATSWTDWYYIDLPALHRFTEAGDMTALIEAQSNHTAYPIPFSLTKESDGRSGQYLYWFDVFGQGISNNEFREFTPCDPQPEPEDWSFAIHRNNVRTNGGAVLETEYTSFDQLPPTSEAFVGVTFTADEWSENDVWCSQEKMLLSLVPSQGIHINRVLSSWLRLEIPPMPPAFIHNNHVFVLRLNDGRYAALQLENYMSPNGTKCWLTINYKYPY